MIDLRPGENFAGCRIVSVCGHGGFGTVYLAENAVGQRVAVKIVNAPDKEAELRGIRLFMELSPRSPYLMPILHVGIERNELFYLMAAADPVERSSPVYVADTLGRRLKLRGRLEPAEALEIVRKLAQAVEALHAAELIHRDIKPDNIVFVGGEPMLLDPGLLRPAECSATLAGTLGFLPPELLSGDVETNGKAGDVYALGKVLYCAFTGENPGRFPHLPRDLGAATCRALLPVLMHACDEKPKKRYADIGEFRRALPDELPGPGVLERFGEKFRLWRLMHGVLWRSVLAAAVLLLIAGAGAAWRMERARVETAALRTAAKNAEKELHERIASGGGPLELQLRREWGDGAAAEFLAACRRIPEESHGKLRFCREAEGRLQRAARERLAAAKRVPDALKRSGELREFLASPLGGMLDQPEMRRLKAELAADERKNGLVRAWSPSPGKVYHPDSSRMFEFAYVPPGDFISTRSGKVVRIDYPMWVGVTELSVRQFSRLVKYIPTGNRELDMPVTRIVFNDLLFACRNAGELFLMLGELPPGYVVRPLTEDEWEYCALAGMRTTPAAASSSDLPGEKRLRRPAAGGANAFGLYDMADNVREIVLSGERSHAGSYVVRGGSWNSASDARLIAKRSEVAFYQSFMPDTGTRLAIAPGTPEQLDGEFRSAEVCHFVANGRHYEFFGHLCASFSPEDAAEICALLGGRPAALDSPEVLKRLCDTASPVFRYPVLAGAEFRDGAWRWSDGSPLRDRLSPPAKGEILIMENGRFAKSKMTRALGFVCEWSEAEWRRRALPDSPECRARVLTEFELDGVKYVLVRVGGYPHLARRFAELLGGRLAEPASPELRRRITEKLGVHAESPVMLGGIWKFGRHHWLGSGKRIEETLPLEGQAVDNARSLAVPALMRGRLCAVQQAERILLEFPAPAGPRR